MMIETGYDEVEREDLGDGWVWYVIRDERPICTQFLTYVKYNAPTDTSEHPVGVIYFGPSCEKLEECHTIKAEVIKRAKESFVENNLTIVDDTVLIRG